MGRSLADIRAAKQERRPERTLTICLAPDLVAEVQMLADELDVIATSGALEPRKMGQGEPERVGEIRDRMRELLAEMDESTGEMRLRAIEDGAWRRWVNAHPARPEGEPGHEADQEVARGYCNADDLLDDLGPFVHAWDGDLLDDGDWAIMAASTARPDKKRIATAVVAMHEQVMDIPKWGRSLSVTLGKWRDDDSLAASAVRPASSSAASPPSDTSTTTPTTD